MLSKCCKRCGAEKPLSDYYAHNRMADGHLNFCKECTKRRVTEHRDVNLERIRKYDRERGSRQTGRKVPEINRKLSNAIRHGKVNRPPCCTAPGCFSTEHIEGHHPDFSNPLNVVWLCRECHRTLHKEFGRKNK